MRFSPVIFCLSASFLLARQSAAPPQAARILEGIQSRYSGLSSLAADFTQVYHAANGRVITESGRLLLKRPNKMRWEYTDPEVKLFISTGRKTYFYVPADRQVIESSIRTSNDAQLPFLFLLRKSDLRTDFESIEIVRGEKTKNGASVVLRVVARRAPPEFRNIFVEADSRTYEIYRISRIEPSGARNDFYLTSIRQNPAAGDDLFRFKVPNGVEVLRGDQ